MHAYIDMRVGVDACVYAGVGAHMFAKPMRTLSLVFIHRDLRLCIYMGTHISMRVRVGMHACVGVDVCVGVYIYAICIYIHIYRDIIYI